MEKQRENILRLARSEQSVNRDLAKESAKRFDTDFQRKVDAEITKQVWEYVSRTAASCGVSFEDFEKVLKVFE